jgi:hypothetical protein
MFHGSSDLDARRDIRLAATFRGLARLQGDESGVGRHRSTPTVIRAGRPDRSFQHEQALDAQRRQGVTGYRLSSEWF